MNKVFLLGRTTSDITVRTLPSGTEKAFFTLAVKRGKDKTDFIPIVALNKLATNTAEYVTKGSQILVEGVLEYKSEKKGEEYKVYCNVLANMITYVNLKKVERTDDSGYDPDIDEDVELPDWED